MSATPAISVVMAVYNGGGYLRAAIESILSQTLGDFELIIVDDGSADESCATIRSYADARVRFIEKPHAGLTAALNLGVAAAQGPLIARMDADDISFPGRFAAQAGYLSAHPEVDVLCADAAIIDERGKVVGAHRMGNVNERLLLDGLLNRARFKPVIHPSVMMRRSVLEALGGYRDYPCAEDQDLWLRACGRFKFASIRQALLYYRIHAGGVSRARRATQVTSGVMSAVNYYVRLETGVDLFVEQRELFERFTQVTARHVAQELLPAQIAFGEARHKLRTQGVARGAVALLKALGQHGPAATPARFSREIGKLSRSLADEVCSEIAQLRADDSPTAGVAETAARGG
ncbi:MAG TPA: glycosyltransferase [Methylocystis sp.]|nr:glycosyltransferase [Methylocystis sp.]